tara:strand:- start:1899 stop:2171 length:273 start_codon:yes stop_codon:yes gene_type:complete
MVDYLKVGRQVQRFHEALIGPMGVRFGREKRSVDDCLHDYMLGVSVHCRLFSPEYGNFRLSVVDGNLALEMLELGLESKRVFRALKKATA